MEIEEKQLAHILLCAQRYCLGRMTYIVTDCVQWLLRYWHILPVEWQKMIQKDIHEAISLGHAGMDMDVKEWKKILELPIITV